jgi:hypothetical protein
MTQRPDLQGTRPAATPPTEQVPLPGQFQPLGEGFVLERIAHIVRIHHDPCRKHAILRDDAAETLADARTRHVCGPRDVPWEKGERR